MNRKRICMLLGLCLVLACTLGGCPEFQDNVVTAFDTAVTGLFTAAIDLFFDQYRTSGAF